MHHDIFGVWLDTCLFYENGMFHPRSNSSINHLPHSSSHPFSFHANGSLFSIFCSFILPLSTRSNIISCFLIKFLIDVVSSSSSSNKDICFAPSWITSSLVASYVSSSSLSFSSNYWICSYATSKAIMYFPICSKCHFLNLVLTSSNSSPISFGIYFTSSSYKIGLVWFSVVALSPPLEVCKVSISTLPCVSLQFFP